MFALLSREALAGPSILNTPEKVDWKACKQSMDEEKATAAAFRKKFKPFDFNLSWTLKTVKLTAHTSGLESMQAVHGRGESDCSSLQEEVQAIWFQLELNTQNSQADSSYQLIFPMIAC